MKIRIENAINRVEIAANDGVNSSRISSQILTGRVRLVPQMNIAKTNSSNEIMKERRPPARTPGLINGKIMSLKRINLLAPSTWAALSILISTPRKIDVIFKTRNGITIIVCAIAIPKIFPIKCISAYILYIEIDIIICDTIIGEIIIEVKKPLDLLLDRTNAYEAGIARIREKNTVSMATWKLLIIEDIYEGSFQISWYHFNEYSGGGNCR